MSAAKSGKVVTAETAVRTFNAAGSCVAVALSYDEMPVFKVKSIDISFGVEKYSKTGNRGLEHLFLEIESWFNGDIDVLPLENLDLEKLSSFEKKILCELRRRVPLGRTVSYGGLAEFAGFPKAARAVGTVMSKNQFPLFFPCHRVIKGDGSIGFFQGGSAGARLKKALLEMEKMNIRARA
jgi:methylated-DNA-[protein]-cysteine S-methyltransferase